jgi:hypothetical protein
MGPSIMTAVYLRDGTFVGVIRPVEPHEQPRRGCPTTEWTGNCNGCMYCLGGVIHPDDHGEAATALRAMGRTVDPR